VTRRGVDVRARKGYWAYTAADAARATTAPRPEAPPAITAALGSIAEPVRGRPARFWVGTSRGENGRTKLTFAWETVAPAPGENRAPDETAARVVLTAASQEGRTVYRGRVPEDVPAAASAEGAGTAGTAVSSGSHVSFEAPPGPMQLRMVVEGPRGQVLDSATRELTLPDFTKVEVAFGTPQVYKARTPREIQAIRKATDALPTADRVFSRTDRLYIRVPAYGPGETVPAIAAKLLNRSGEPMADIPMLASTGVGEIEFALSNLAPGDYILQFTAKTDTGTAQEHIALRVGR
jgi:hypothetical protein